MPPSEILAVTADLGEGVGDKQHDRIENIGVCNEEQAHPKDVFNDPHGLLLIAYPRPIIKSWSSEIRSADHAQSKCIRDKTNRARAFPNCLRPKHSDPAGPGPILRVHREPRPSRTIFIVLNRISRPRPIEAFLI